MARHRQDSSDESSDSREMSSGSDTSLDTSAASSGPADPVATRKPPPGQYVVFSQPDGTADLGNTGQPTQPQPQQQRPRQNQHGGYPQQGGHPQGQQATYVSYHMHPGAYPQYTYPQQQANLAVVQAATMSAEELLLLEEFARIVRMSRTVKILSIIDVIGSIFWFLTDFWWAGFLVVFAPFGYVGAQKFNPSCLIGYLVYTVLDSILRIVYLATLWDNSGSLFKILQILSVIISLFIFSFVYQFMKAIPKEGMGRYAIFAPELAAGPPV